MENVFPIGRALSINLRVHGNIGILDDEAGVMRLSPSGNTRSSLLFQAM